jgi:hypothetical protein
MVYNIQNDCVFGLSASSSILETMEQRFGLRLAFSKGPNSIGVSPLT